METAEPNVPATGAMAATISARSHASRVAMNAPADIPVAKTRPGAMPYSRVSRSMSADEEPHVVDTLAVGDRRAAAVGPAEVDAIGVCHDEPVLVGDGVVVRQRRLPTAGRSGAVQIDHEACRMVEASRDMHLIGAWQSPDHQLTWSVSTGKRRCARAAVGDETQKGSDDSWNERDIAP